MLKRTATIAVAATLMIAVALIAIGDAGQATACDGKTKTASAKALGCTKTASAAKVSAGKSGCSKTAAQSACCARMAKQAHYAQVREAADVIPYRENTRVELTGTYKCGMCDLGATDTCQAFIKTASGQLYPLDKNSKVKQMYKSGEKEFKVTARVIKQGGTKYLNVTNYSSI